jgi:preprotein translocase subunit YajC
LVKLSLGRFLGFDKRKFAIKVVKSFVDQTLIMIVFKFVIKQRKQKQEKEEKERKEKEKKEKEEKETP